MKTLYYFNVIVFSITVLLYITIVYGLLAQFVLGIIQLLCALGLIFYWKRFTVPTKKRLRLYWLFIGVYILISVITAWLATDTNLQNTAFIVVGVVFPLIIAGYFLYVLNKIKFIK